MHKQGIVANCWCSTCENKKENLLDVYCTIAKEVWLEALYFNSEQIYIFDFVVHWIDILKSRGVTVFFAFRHTLVLLLYIFNNDPSGILLKVDGGFKQGQGSIGGTLYVAVPTHLFWD